jgi:hypothetical protein
MKKYAFNAGIKYEVNAFLFQKCKKYNITLCEALIFGNIKMLKYIYEFNKYSNSIFSLHNYTLSNAALSGNIKCLVYAYPLIEFLHFLGQNKTILKTILKTFPDILTIITA